jgi:hypothetical protein
VPRPEAGNAGSLCQATDQSTGRPRRGLVRPGARACSENSRPPAWPLPLPGNVFSDQELVAMSTRNDAAYRYGWLDALSAGNPTEGGVVPVLTTVQGC